MPHALRLPVLSLLLLAFAVIGCGDAEPESNDPVADAKRVLQQAELAELRTTFPERVASICSRFDTNTSPHAEACEKAALAIHERLVEHVAASPVEWQNDVLALGNVCLRHAFRIANSEIEGRTEAELLVEGLEEGPRCLDDSYEKLAEDRSKRDAATGAS